jgi:Ca2+-binding EF-hand superfamily protein
MTKRSWLTISAICTIGGISVAAAQGGADHFAKLDTNKDGVLTAAELEADAATRFTTLDANKDGKLTPDERKAEHEKRALEHFKERDQNGNGVLERGEVSRMPEHMFTRLDADKSGSLSSSEMKGFMGHHGHGPRGDKNHDGDHGLKADHDKTLTKAEFVARAQEHLKRLDANSDGKLTADELKAHHGRGPGRGHDCGKSDDDDQ